MANTAPPGQEIPLDGASANAITPIYSANRLKNADAGTGVLTPWQTEGVTAVPGGPDGSSHTFKLEPGIGYLKQVIPAEGRQPSDYKIGGYFLPDRAAKAEDVRVSAYVKVTYKYADGTEDIAMIPVRGAVSNGS